MSYAQDITEPTFRLTIFMSGPIEVAKQYLREECMREGLCVTIEPTLFIYTGGEESGFRVGLLNYPRFPSTAAELRDRALRIAGELLVVTRQHSALMVDAEESRWISRRL